MNFFSKLIVIILVVLSLLYVKDKFFTNESDNMFNKEAGKTEIHAPFDGKDKEEEPPITKTEENTGTKEIVSIYFTNATNGSLKKITRELPENEAKLNFAVKELINGPDYKEKKLGYSSEIPKGTKILNIKDQGGIIVIDLSDEFQYGGGTESQYTRVNQLIKTILALKPDKPVYLYLNGQKAEVIGGEGIILNQPLSENSLNG